MGSFARKQNQAQEHVSSGLRRSNAATPRPNHHAHPILHLQRTIGNRAVQRLLRTRDREPDVSQTGAAATTRFAQGFGPVTSRATRPPQIQPKLTVNAPGDVYEQEADRAAEQVMRMPEPVRQLAGHGDENCRECRQEHGGRPRLQTKTVRATGSEEVEAAPVVEEALRSPGQPLDSSTREFMEARFGRDFSGVRVHTSARADEAARAVNALAYTVGQDIVFGAGRYAPHAYEGRRLLAHELTHTIQQSQSQPVAGYDDAPAADAQSTGEGEAGATYGEGVRGNVQTSARPGGGDAVLQRQFITPLGQGGGFGGLMERDRRAAAPPPPLRVAPGLQTVKVWINAFIPMATAGPYAGDSRGFSNDIHASHRTHQEIEFEAATLHRTIDWKHIGTSHLVVPALVPGAGSPAGPFGMFPRPTLIPVVSATASTNTLTNGPVQPSGNEVLVHFEADAANPLAPGAPAINLVVDFHIDLEHRTAKLLGNHDGFPAYEAYVTANGGAGTAVYTYDPRDADEDPSALFPPMDKSVSTGPVSF